MEKLIEKS